MPLGNMTADSTELIGYLISALWIVTGLCAIVVGAALAFFFLTAKAIRRTPNTLPELHQFGATKERDRHHAHDRMGLSTAQ